MKIVLSSLFIAIVLIVGCKTTKTSTTPSYTYSNYVKTVIDMNCGNSCHSADHPAAGIELTTYESVKEQALHGKLIPAIQHAEGVEPMPRKNPQLDSLVIQRIVDWAAAGAPM